MINLDQVFSGIENVEVIIAGDIMLDTYWWGNVDRISPEAPVPVLSRTHTEYRIGGAGNVALNTVALGAHTHLFSVTGNDEAGDVLLKKMENANIHTSNIVRSNERHTTNKIRIMGRNQQMMRIDDEVTEDISEVVEKKLLENFKDCISKQHISVVIFEDYNKGVLTKNVIREMQKICNEKNILTTVDPKHKNFFEYKNAGIFKPNLKEVREALHLTFEELNEDVLQNIHAKLSEVLSHQISLITLSEKGIFAQNNLQHVVIPSHNRNIADVSGAGDTVIAVASLVYAVSMDIILAAKIANIAGGLVCEEVGTMPVNKKRLQEECLKLL